MRISFYQEKQVKLISTWHRHRRVILPVLHIYPVRTCPTAVCRQCRVNSSSEIVISRNFFTFPAFLTEKKKQSNDKIEDKISVAAVKTNVVFYCGRCSVWSFEEMYTLLGVHRPVHFFTNAGSSKK